MPAESETLRAALLKSAKSEFMANGFAGASMRKIAAGANATTGALYGYFKDKSELFSALVSPCFHEFIHIFQRGSDDWLEWVNHHDTMFDQAMSAENLLRMTNYMYDNLDEFKLLVFASEKSAYENFTHMMIDMEVDMTLRYLETMIDHGYPDPNISKQEIHMFVNAQFSAFFEMIIHDVPRDKALAYTRRIFSFFLAGWQSLLET